MICCSFAVAAEQKARTTYDNILRFTDDPDVIDPIRFLREREVVHYQRFGEGLRITTDKLNSKNFYAFNPSFDRCDKKEKCEKKGKEKTMDCEKTWDSEKMSDYNRMPDYNKR